MPSAPLVLRIDPKGLTQLYQDAKAAEGALQVELRKGIKTAAAPLVKGVQAEASFSSRIPGAVKTKVSFAKKGATVAITVDPKRAPEAAPINNGGRSGTFRHPVYGNRDNWVSQPADPFFDRGTRNGEPGVDTAMLKVMDDIAHKLGFK